MSLILFISDFTHAIQVVSRSDSCHPWKRHSHFLLAHYLSVLSLWWTHLKGTLKDVCPQVSKLLWNPLPLSLGRTHDLFLSNVILQRRLYAIPVTRLLYMTKAGRFVTPMIRLWNMDESVLLACTRGTFWVALKKQAAMIWMEEAAWQGLEVLRALIFRPKGNKFCQILHEIERVSQAPERNTAQLTPQLQSCEILSREFKLAMSRLLVHGN